MKKRFCHNFGPAELVKIGSLLYGPRWQTELAKRLGMADSRIVRYWLARDRHIPVYIWKEIFDLVKERQAELQSLVEEFDSIAT